jgi:hypothetical protein
MDFIQRLKVEPSLLITSIFKILSQKHKCSAGGYPSTQEIREGILLGKLRNGCWAVLKTWWKKNW